MEQEITASVHLTGGKAITEANLHRIKAIGRQEYDGIYASGEKVTGIPVYQAIRERRGYIFRDSRFDLGIDGHHKTLRGLIISTLVNYGHRVKVVIE